MARMMLGIAAAFAVVFLSPATSRAGQKYEVSLEGVCLDPSQDGPVNGAPPVDCSSITDCTFTPTDPMQGAHNPAIIFNTSADATLHIEVPIWGASDCPGIEDARAVGDLMFPAGANLVRIVFTPPLDDGTPFSIEWMLGGCPITACANYVLGTPPPDFCPM